MKRKIVSILLAGLLVTGIFGCGESASTEDCVQTTDESSQTSDDNTESADASEQLSQEYIYAYITALEGNEVTYVEVEESVIEAMQEEKEETEMSGETVTTYIPVGTIVHTADGAETTFSRLAAGDIVKILVETDDGGEAVIVEIWMVEQ